MSKNQEILLTNSAVDFLKEKIGGGGTTVVANPTLSGTEANLTGLQVDETKYKVPTTALGQIITVDETNFTVYDWFFNTPIDENQTLYRVGIVFRNKNTNEDYVIVCTTDKNIDKLDSEDPGFFQQCIGMVRGGDLVLYSQSLTHLGVVCLYTTSESTYTEIRMLM